MTCLFWICTGLLAYTFAGYQVLITLLARVRRRRAMPGGGAMASACVLIVAHNEEARIGARIANVREGEPDIEVIVVSDGSMDGTAAAAREAGARVIEFAEKRGKAACLSEVAPGLGCDVIVLTDCRQKFTRETTGKLLRHFADAGIGAVSGILRIGGGGTAAGEGVGTYWKLETAVRQAESDFDSCVGCTGAVYAVRRECFRPIPADTILDDVVIPMHVVTAGRRVIYDGAAEAYDPQSLDPALEQRRKARTLAGNFQMMVRYPGWMLPWRNRLAFQLISHKYLRLAGPLMMAGALGSSVALMRQPLYAVCLGLQLALYALAGVGLVAPGMKGRVFSAPAGFLFLNGMTVRGFWRYCFGPRGGAWE